MGQVGDGDALFLHGFEKGGLGFRGGSVDFVGEQHVAENWALLENEFSAAFAIHQDLGSDDIAGEEIRGELDALEIDVDGLGDGVDEGGFAEAGNAFEKDVAAAADGDEDIIDDFLLADDEGGYGSADFAEGIGEMGDGGFEGIGGSGGHGDW